MTDDRIDPNGEDDELTAVELEALARLPREKEPSDLLEGRIVQLLRERGTLVDRGSPARSSGVGFTSRGVPVWAAVAAGFALFLCGGLAGHRLGARSATDAFLAVREQDAALRVQEVGSAYVRSLMALETLRAESGADSTVGRGREVATTTLHAAARIMARLDPEDPLPPVLIELLEDRMRGETRDQAAIRRTFSF